MSQIETLTPEQEALIPVYRDRWRQLCLETRAASDPVEGQRSKAKAAVTAVYAALERRSPDVLFFSGPQAARAALGQKTVVQLLQQLGVPLVQLPLAAALSQQVRSQLAPELLQDLTEQLQTQPLGLLSFRLQTLIWSQLSELIDLQQGQTPQEQQQFSELLLEQALTQVWEQQQREWRQQMQQQPGGDLLLQWGDSLWQWGDPVGKQVEALLWQPLRQQPLVQDLERGLRQLLGLFSLIGTGLGAIRHSVDALPLCLLDYCFSVLQIPHHSQHWQALRSLAPYYDLIVPFEQACLVFDRPLRLSVDAEGRLHAEGEPAVQFADGFGLYCFRDVQLPERYGRLHPELWRSEWLLQETNAELRRVLIQGIGYARLCQELQAIAIDSWREYTLLRIDSPVDVEPIHLLKMTCPSTGYIHATRVPPELDSARAAIRWVNWGTDPEEFGTET